MYSVDGKELGKYIVFASGQIQMVSISMLSSSSSSSMPVEGMALDDVILWDPENYHEIPGTKVLTRYDEQSSERSSLACFGANSPDESLNHIER